MAAASLVADAASLRALKIFHYASPPIGAVIFLLVATSLVFFTRSDEKSGKNGISHYRFVCFWLLLLIIVAHVAEVVSYIARALIEPGWFAPRESNTYGMVSILLWGGAIILLSDGPSLTWHPYVAAWTTLAACETTISILTARTDGGDFHLGIIPIVLSSFRAVVCAGLVSFILISISNTCKTSHGLEDAEQARPLLGSSSASSETAYGAATTPTVEAGQKTLPSDDDEEAEDDDDKKAIKEQQRKRLEEAGGWWGYVKGFGIFLPYLFPVKNRKVQVYLCVLCLCLLSERALIILIPRQLGIITDAFTSTHEAGYFPWREILVWTGLRWAQSSAGIYVIRQFFTDRVSQFSQIEMYNLAFSHVMSLSVDFHTDKSTGEVIKGVQQADSLCDLLQTSIFEFSPIIVDILLAVSYMTYLFDVYLAILVLAVGIVYLFATYKMTKLQLPLRRRYTKSERAKYRMMHEAISNWSTVAFFNQQGFEESEFSGAVTTYIRDVRSYANIIYLGHAIQGLTMTLGLLGAALMAAYRVSEGSAPVGNFIVLITMWSSISYPLAKLAHSYKWVASLLIDAERLLQLLQTKPSVISKDGAPPIHVSEGAVQFDHVSFSYDPRKKALNDVDFSIRAGSTVAFVGETGGGKSTILRLLLRLYDVGEGAVRIDGQDVRDVALESLRESFGVVPQDPSLFNRSILENIRYGRLDATDEEIYGACKAASVHDKILSFPEGYQSKVGERGVKLSGGELQRVAIARVILKNPKIVLLDEATSSVDSATEETIQESFRKLSLGRTTFVVAHRLSTIKNADMIVVVDGGKVVERGTHEELIGKGGKYDMLWSRQSAKLTPRTGSEATHRTKDQADVGELLIDVSTETLTAELAKTAASECSGNPIDQLDGACSSKLCGKDNGDSDDDGRGEGSSQQSQEDETSLRAISPRPTAALDIPFGQSGRAPKKPAPGPLGGVAEGSGGGNNAKGSTKR